MSIVVATEIEKAVAEMRPAETTDFHIHYVNRHGVPVRRHIRIEAEQVDGAVIQGAA